MCTKTSNFRAFRLKWMVAVTLLSSVSAQAHTFPLDNLLPFYVDWNQYQGFYNSPLPPPIPLPTGPTASKPLPELFPKILTTRGDSPGYYASVDGSGHPIFNYHSYEDNTANNWSFPNSLQGYLDESCTRGELMNSPPVAGMVEERLQGQHPARSESSCSSFQMIPPTEFSLDRYVFGPIVRRKALDGSEYEATSLKITRDGFDWYTHHFGYNLGLVAHESNWDPANRAVATNLMRIFKAPDPANDFELVVLPPPWVENEVTEYVNRADFPAQPDGQYFYAVRDDDKAVLDGLPNWNRTGKSFLSGGYNGGPNTHFYSANAEECEVLKQYAWLSYEGQTFAASLPMPPKNEAQAVPGALRDCPSDSKPLYRLYNAASTSNGRWVSNHRYTTDRTDVTNFVQRGWLDEGHVMCVPS